MADELTHDEEVSEDAASASGNVPPTTVITGQPIRITPRNSALEAEIKEKETPYASLVELAKAVNKPTTPERTQPSPAQRRSVRRTPGAGRLAPRTTAKSPYAVRAFERRAVTPGREVRRKSGRFPAQQRETPRDALRALSRQLLGNSQPYQEAESVASVHNTPRRTSSYGVLYSDPGPGPEEEEELSPPPRLSINLNDLEQEEHDEPAPRLSAPLDEIQELTNHSIELGRRAYSENLYGGRPSFGIRLSDRFADFNEIGALDEEAQGEISGIYDPDREGLGDLSNGDGDIPPGRMSLIQDGEEEQYEDEGDMSLPDHDQTENSFYLPMPEDDDNLANAIAEEGDSMDAISAGHAASKGLSTKKRPKLPVSRHGIEYPLLPRKVVKRLATNSSGSNISNETLNAIMAASEAFFEQVGDDLHTYAHHAGRKSITDADALQLLRRQRRINPQTTAFSLAQKHLPRELLQELRMPHVHRRPKSRPKLAAIHEEEGAEDG